MDEKLVAIIVGARGLFIEYGIRNISMDDISKTIGISKKTLYKYVSNKMDLLDKIFIYYNKLIEDRITEIIYAKYNAIDTLLEISKVVKEQWQQMDPKLEFELHKYYPDIQKKNFEILNRHTSKGMKFNLAQGIEEGLYRKDINIDLTIEFYMKQLRNINNMEACNKDQFSFETVFTFLFENHIRILASEEGLKYFENTIKKYKHNNS